RGIRRPRLRPPHARGHRRGQGPAAAAQIGAVAGAAAGHAGPPGVPGAAEGHAVAGRAAVRARPARSSASAAPAPARGRRAGYRRRPGAGMATGQQPPTGLSAVRPMSLANRVTWALTGSVALFLLVICLLAYEAFAQM